MTPYPFLDVKANTAAIREDLDKAIARVLDHCKFINGPELTEFESQWAEYCEAKYAIGTANGTASLQTILHALGVGPGSEVILPSHTFMATAEAVVLQGAKPVFVEVLDSTMLIDPTAVAEAITDHTKAILAVDLYGLPADYERLHQVADKHEIPIVEDAAQAHGASIGGKTAGTLGAAAAFSFFPGKNLGAFGDGGGLTTNDEKLADRCRAFVNHGRESKYVHDFIGTNFRLDTLQAAILTVKLAHLDKWNERRRAIAARYVERLSAEPFDEYPISWQRMPKNAVSSYHLFVIRVEGLRDAVRRALSQRGVTTGMHYPVPCHLQPAMAAYGYRPGSLPLTERICDELISLPIGPEMPVEHADEIMDILAEELGRLMSWRRRRSDRPKGG
ncbi:DegT/DnrJ/EryC1/StrS family aminotransferase [bacterium]|nr:DegT/DnrJ/EryC1/StrS family aminotransferase [bacterium]